MNRLRSNLVRAGLPILALLLVTALLASCGSDDPVAPAATNHAPSAPAINAGSGGPADGAVDVALDAQLYWTCTDPDDDPLTYTVHFGTTATPPMVAENLTTGNHAPVGMANSTTYYWQIIAVDDNQKSTSSPVWSFTTVATGIETINPPAAPSGPTTGLENEDLAYTAAGAVSTLGHTLEYQFDWGDGQSSDWGISTVQHSWPTAGSYNVTARARCAEHTTIVSDWSDTTTVAVTAYSAETVSAPSTPSGSATGETGQSISYATGGAVSSDGHAVQYSFDWGDGTTPVWTTALSQPHSWSAAGSYQVKAQARCATHPAIVSEWSAALTVTISLAAGETVSAPDAPGAPATGETDQNLVVTVSGGVSSMGHPVQHRVDFGDGMTAWYSSLTSIQHAWTTAGTYDIKVQARCATHPTIVSAWSVATSIEISDPAETIPSPPGAIAGVTNGAINEAYDYNVFHSLQTNLGNPVEGRFDWADGTFSSWSAASDHSATHTWTTVGTYIVSYQARSTTDHTVTADAESLVVVINTVAAESVSAPPYANYERSAVVNEPIEYRTYGGASSLGHAVETRFDWGDGSPFSDWYPDLTPVSKTWTTAGLYSMARQSRCVEHPDVISEWSAATTITVLDPEFITTPDAPAGPATGARGERLYYTASGAASSWGHTNYIEYRYDWGDGSALSDWSQTETNRYHQYAAVGDYEVKVQARDAFPGHVAPESDWSLPTAVSILEQISTGNYRPTGPDFGGINESYEFTAPYAQSDLGHSLEYRFDWGDGSFSNWSASQTASHTWVAAGTYDLAYQARCEEHTTAVSDWSLVRQFDVTADPESVTAPTVTRLSSGLAIVGHEQTFTVYDAVSTYGHTLEFQVDFGDGQVSPWTAGLPGSEDQVNFKHTYTSVGSFDLTAKARCAAHTAVESAASAVLLMEVWEDMETPAAPTGPLTGTVGENLTYSAVAVSSSEGHALEYSFVYYDYSRRQSQSDWSSSLSDTHVFTAASSGYKVQVMVRCAEHPNVTKESGFLTGISITAK